jgi:hypothetical protein
VTRRAGVAVAAFAVVVLAAFVLPAVAAHTNQTDPDDTRGPLDVRTVRFTHAGAPTWRVATFARWSTTDIWDRGYVIVELDTKGDDAIDHLAVVRSDGRDLVGVLYRVRRDGGQIAIGVLEANKDGASGAAVSVALRRLRIGPGRTLYRWAVVTTFTGPGCPRTCVDLVPNEGMVEQLLPGVTPTPTPSPSPTATPSPTPAA